MTTRGIAGHAVLAARPAAPRDTNIWIVAGVAVALPLVVPYGLALGMGGSLFRLFFPVYVIGLSLACASYRRWLYPAFIIAVFAFAAFLRRVADNSGGFVSFNLVLVTPYFGLLPTLPAFTRRLLGQRPGPVWPFVTLLAIIVYGVFSALLHGAALVSAFYEPARWLLPIALCAFIMDEPDDVEAMRRSLVNGLALILPILTAYGVYQYIVAPSWDVLWMINIDNFTFGDPEPYKIRVFSMLNSPFSAAAFATMAMILLAGEGPVQLVIAGLGTLLLGLTLVRTGWLGLGVGLVWLLLNAPPSRKLLLLVGAVVVTFAGFLLLAVPVVAPQVAAVMNSRLDSLENLQSDSSANVRFDFYSSFYERLDDYPFGEGFGAAQSIVTLQNKQSNQPLDSGVLEALLVYGVVGAGVYFSAVAALVHRAFALSRRSPRELAGCMAVVTSVLVMSFLGSYQLGEIGTFAWAALGIVLAHGAAKTDDQARQLS